MPARHRLSLIYTQKFELVKDKLHIARNGDVRKRTIYLRFFSSGVAYFLSSYLFFYLLLETFYWESLFRRGGFF